MMKKIMRILGSLAVGLSWTLMAVGADSSSLASLSLGPVANASRLDQIAGDGKGGWIDLGSNDLHVLPAGQLKFCGVPFDIPVDTCETNRTCLVLGRSGKAESATLPLPENPGPFIYLLHATANSLSLKQDMIGIVRIHYADGSSSKMHVRIARDVADWTLGKSFKNAFKAWTKYNDNMQVALFASKFPIEKKTKPVSVEFKAYGQCPWMILAATHGADVHVEAERVPLELNRTYRTPPPRTKELPKVDDGRRPRNVVLLIGDGMGEGVIDFTSQYCHGRAGALQMQQLPVSAHCTTLNECGMTTDSAASATAIATGTKTSNGMVGLRIRTEGDRKEEETLVPVAQRAHEKGLAVGLLTSDRLTGATPSGFYAHVRGRGESAKIAEQAAACGYEILIGNGGTAEVFKKIDMTKAGYVTAKSLDALKSAPKDAKVFGSIDSGNDEDTLAKCLTDVLGRLAANEKGFFLMAECATPDGGGHGNKPERSALGVVQTDWMVSAALDFAAERGDTLVIVTADHETGRVRALKGKDGRVNVSYGSTNHSELPVALFASGPGSERFKGMIDNTDISKIVTQLLGL